MFGSTQELEGIELAREFKLADLATHAADADRAIARALVFPSRQRNWRPICGSVPDTFFVPFDATGSPDRSQQVTALTS
jgi:hypothetical protein